METPRSPRDTVSNVIEKIAETLKYVEYEADIKEISAHGANLTSALFLATLNAKEKEELKLFAKVAVMGDDVRKICPIPRPFATEIYFYEKVLKLFELMQEKHSVPEQHRLVFPKIYGTNDQYLYETLVMDNLIAKGYKCYERQKTIDLEYASTAIALIAKFHALSLACHKEYPDDFEEVLTELNFDTTIMESLMGIMKPKMIDTAMKVASDENKEKLEKYLTGEDAEHRFLQFISFYHGKGSRLLGHGDFKPSNLMHRRRNEKLEVIPVDFQMVRRSTPVADLMYFFFTGADEEFRRRHYHELLDQYYEQLKLALGRLNLNYEEMYPEKTYRKDLEEVKMIGMMIGVILLPMITAEDANRPTFDSRANVTDLFVPGSELYKERFNGILNNYREWGLL